MRLHTAIQRPLKKGEGGGIQRNPKEQLRDKTDNLDCIKCLKLTKKKSPIILRDKWWMRREENKRKKKGYYVEKRERSFTVHPVSGRLEVIACPQQRVDNGNLHGLEMMIHRMRSIHPSFPRTEENHQQYPRRPNSSC